MRIIKTVFQPVLDAKNVIVETQIKVHKKIWEGCHTILTINLYHTSCRMIANCKGMENFQADHKKVVECNMNLNVVESLDSMPQGMIRAQLDKMTSNMYMI